MIYQQPNWIKSMNVIENVAFPVSLQGYAKKEAFKKAMQQLEIVGMQDWAQYKPSELSSGQQQKIALARALVNEPQIIVADEPTGNLDFKSTKALMDLFKKLTEEGKTIIMVTHEVVNLDFADKIFCFMDGDIVDTINTKGKSKDKIRNKVLSYQSNAEGVDSEESFEVDKEKIGSEIKKKRRFKIKAPKFKNIGRYILRSVYMLILVFISIYEMVESRVGQIKLIPDILKNGYQSTFGVLKKNFKKRIDINEFGFMSYFYIVNISFKNMFSKRARSLITIGGVAIGISFISLLLSIGFGAERLVIDRVASLNSLKQFEAIPAINTQVNLNDNSLNDIGNIQGITDVLPIIGVAGKVEYNGSSLDYCSLWSTV